MLDALHVIIRYGTCPAPAPPLPTSPPPLSPPQIWLSLPKFVVNFGFSPSSHFFSPPTLELS
jgi:hypothetical protein